MEVSLFYNAVFCPNCCNIQRITREQADEVRKIRAKYNAETHGMYNIEFESEVRHFCECEYCKIEEDERDDSNSYLITLDCDSDGILTVQLICSSCKSAVGHPYKDI